MFTLDTNIFIYYAAGDKKVSEFILEKIKEGATLIVPTIVVTEFLSFPGLSPKDRKLFSNLLRNLRIIPLDFEIAEKAATLRRKYKRKLGDSVVAATALVTKSKLVTRNILDFKKIPRLSIVSL